MSIAAQLLDLSIKSGKMICCAESCTGGMVAAALTDAAGSSAMFDRGFVTYTNAAKVAMLGVQQATLDTYGAVSEQVADEMAAGALAHSDAQIAIAITGIAGPGGSEHKPEGRVCFGLALGDRVTVETCEFGALGRHAVRIAARDHALALLLGAMTQDA
jgi:nicotinamide-nucleotide amidase